MRLVEYFLEQIEESLRTEFDCYQTAIEGRMMRERASHSLEMLVIRYRDCWTHLRQSFLDLRHHYRWKPEETAECLLEDQSWNQLVCSD